MATSRAFAQQAKTFVKQFMTENKVLVQYLRRPTGEEGAVGTPYGVVVAFNLRPNGLINHVVKGHSVCYSEQDNFNKYVGLYIAIQRALKGGHNSFHNAKALAAVYGRMTERSNKYFKPGVGYPTPGLPTPDAETIDAANYGWNSGQQWLEKVCRDV